MTEVTGVSARLAPEDSLLAEAAGEVCPEFIDDVQVCPSLSHVPLCTGGVDGTFWTIVVHINVCLADCSINSSVALTARSILRPALGCLNNDEPLGTGEILLVAGQAVALCNGLTDWSESAEMVRESEVGGEGKLKGST